MNAEEHKNRYIPHPYGECYVCFIETLEMILLSGCVLYILFLFLCLVPSSLDQVRTNSFGLTTRPSTTEEDTIYHGTCEFNWDNFTSGFDISLVIQIFYYIILAFGIRSRLYLWINSIIWELVAYIIYKIPFFNLQYNQQCWYVSIIINILIMNAISIEIGLLILKYIIKYPRHQNWLKTIKNMIVCKRCNLKWLFITFNLLFAGSLNLFLNIIFYEHIIWIGTLSWLSIIRCFMVTLGLNICFAQLYRWIYGRISCYPSDILGHLYWMFIIWTIFILEFSIIIIQYYEINSS
eukprot:435280_1